jgi:hypothetical protein
MTELPPELGKNFGICLFFHTLYSAATAVSSFEQKNDHAWLNVYAKG